jgi:hypothetical protein
MYTYKGLSKARLCNGSSTLYPIDVYRETQMDWSRLPRKACSTPRPSPGMTIPSFDLLSHKLLEHRYGDCRGINKLSDDWHAMQNFAISISRLFSIRDNT